MKNPVIGIIGGNGKMGGLFASFFRENGIKVLISDLETKLKNTELASKSDITIISVPMDQTLKIIREILPYVRKESALMDFTSVKEEPVKAMLKGKCEVLGLHPMFGESNPIPGQSIIVTPTKKSGPFSTWMTNFLEQKGAKIYKMSPKNHDKLMAAVQGLIHFADIAFADALRRQNIPIKELFKYTSKACELKIMLAARLIAQSPNLYGNIQIQNPYNLKGLKIFQESIEQLIKIIRKKDLKSFTDYFQKSAKFFGNYTHEAFDESSDLIQVHIDKLANKITSNGRTKAPGPQKSDLALLGPKNTFSDLAAADMKVPKYYAKDIEEVFELVEQGKVALGLVPIENKLQGSVRETMDCLFANNVHVTGEIRLPIHHCLISHKNSSKPHIRTIISHYQALSQCKKYLRKNFPKAKIQTATSTAAAIEKLNSANHIAVIAPESAALAQDKGAQNNKLKILAKNIEDAKDNETIFITIAKGKCEAAKKHPRGCLSKVASRSHAAKTSIAFYFSQDKPGSLFTIFKIFKDSKINMTKVESRPTQAKFGQYIFFLDFEGHISEPKIQKALEQIETNVAKLKILGSY